MLVLELAGIRLYRPTLESEQEFRDRAASYLRIRYQPQAYTNKTDIDEILKCLLGFYEQQIDTALLRILSRSFLEFMLFQYDQFHRLHEIARAGQLQPEEIVVWENLAPTYGRAIKFILERCLLLGIQSDARFDHQTFTESSDCILICAESLIELSILSDQTYYLFPDDTLLEITAAPNNIFFRLQIVDPNKRQLAEEFPNRVRADNGRTSSAMSLMTLENDPHEMDSFLATSFHSSLGLSFEEVINLLLSIDLNIHPPTSGFPTYFMPKDELVGWLGENHGSLMQLQLENILAGFTVSKAGIQSDGGRAYWKPTAEYRALSRGLFEIERGASEKLICWSKEMYRENFQHLIAAVTYGILPKEWSTPPTVRAIGNLTRELGRRFEQRCQIELEALKFKCVISRTSIGSNANRLSLVPAPGEIDL